VILIYVAMKARLRQLKVRKLPEIGIPTDNYLASANRICHSTSVNEEAKVGGLKGRIRFSIYSMDISAQWLRFMSKHVFALDVELMSLLLLEVGGATAAEEQAKSFAALYRPTTPASVKISSCEFPFDRKYWTHKVAINHHIDHA
jgi:hypothetical protein